MEQQVNTYQGMNKDTAYDSIGQELYIDAVDIRITTTTGESMGAFTNIKGNQEAFVVPSYGTFNSLPWTALNPEIIGYTTIRNRIIFFVADAEGNKGWIYDLQYDPKTREILSGFPDLKYYSDQLYFKKDWPIEALGRYETDSIQRIYWTDYNNFFRTINLEATNLATLPVGQVDIFPDLAYTQPILEVVAGGGALMSGEYQVAYRLLTLDGKETLISPPSNLIHVTSDSETLVISSEYNGDLIPVNTFKSLSFKVDTSDYADFDKIEFIVAYHSGLNSIPVVTSVEKISIAGQPTVTFVYTGTEGSSFPIELLTYTAKNHAFKTPKTITQKDSSLVIANIKGSTIALSSLLDGGTFDAKTARYNSSSQLPQPLTGTPEQIEEKKLLNAFNNTADLSYGGVDELGYNSDAHWNADWQTNKQFRYQADGYTLGGEGPNISYKFHLEKFTMDGSSDPGIAKVANIPFGFPYDIHDLQDGYVYNNTTYPNNASPFISGLLRGYKRGETYRFGIVFYTLKGEATYVEYIGDIKFPDISEEDSTVNASDTAFWPISQISDVHLSNVTWGYSMGIEFTIDFSSCPSLLNNIESYQIVRVQRTNSDKRRLTQGIVKGFYLNPPVEGPFDFDLRGPGDSNNILFNYPFYPKEATVDTAAYPNATLKTIHSTDGSQEYPQIADYEVLGEYLGFYSPELSFNYNNARNLATSLGGNPCLLITGAYNNLKSAGQGNTDGRNRSGVGLGELDYDIRVHYRNVNAITFNSIHNVKKWENSQFMIMEDTADYQAKITGNFGGYYMRNYWCMDDWREAEGGDSTVNPNDPTGNNNNNTKCHFYKSGSNLIGQLAKIETDFLTNVPILPAPTYDYFYTYSAGGSDSAGNFITVKDNDGNIDANLFSSSYPIMDLVLPKLEIYGGYSRDALETNIFIQASPVISKANISGTTDTFKVFGGDTFVNMFTLQSGMTEFNTEFYGNQKYGQDNTKTEVFPVESTINLDLACGASLRTSALYEFSGLTLPEFRQEVNNFDSAYGKSLSMYAYNGAYSRENQDVTFFVEPLNSPTTLVNDIRAFLSNVKYNGEVIDSWTKFGVNNFYDVDDYGPINKVLNWKDTVYFIQDRGIGAYAINRAAITTTADGVPTSLGTGQGFGKHQYFSKEHGSIHQWALRATDTAIYFFDAINRKIFMFRTQQGQGDAAPLSEVKGMHSFLQNLPANVYKTKTNGGDNPIRSKGVVVAKDKINDEVYFTFVGTKPILILLPDTYYEYGDIVQSGINFYQVDFSFMAGSNRPAAFADLEANSTRIPEPTEKNQTLVFDELAQAFSSLYSATPKLYLENGDILLSANPKSPANVYTHNIGEWGSFYGNVEECSITLVINPKADINKILRTFEFNSIVRDDAKVIDRTKTITAFQITTQYQDTGKVFFSADRIKRKFDKWRVKIPRNQLSANQQDRLRSTYFVLTLYFDNQENTELIMNRIISSVDFQMF